MLKTGLRWLWIAVIVLLLDRLTKYFALKTLIAYIPQAVFPGFNLTLAYNTGAAFSFLDQAGGWQTWFLGSMALAVCLGIVIWLSRISCQEKTLGISLALIIGGALGNVWDRVLYGHVIDFIQVYYSQYAWPTFNIADSAICLGALLMLLQLRAKKHS